MVIVITPEVPGDAFPSLVWSVSHSIVSILVRNNKFYRELNTRGGNKNGTTKKKMVKS